MNTNLILENANLSASCVYDKCTTETDRQHAKEVKDTAFKLMTSNRNVVAIAPLLMDKSKDKEKTKRLFDGMAVILNDPKFKMDIVTIMNMCAKYAKSQATRQKILQRYTCASDKCQVENMTSALKMMAGLCKMLLDPKFQAKFQAAYNNLLSSHLAAFETGIEVMEELEKQQGGVKETKPKRRTIRKRASPIA
jgi:hypothetical protein